MSVCCDTREYFMIADAEEGCECVDLLRRHLAVIGVMMLLGNVRNCEIYLETDQKAFRFDGTKVSEQLQDIVDALDQAQKVDAKIFWNSRRAAWEELELAGASSVCRELQDAAWAGAIPESVFYCCYEEADYDMGIGVLRAYGYRNGQYFDGEVPYENVDALPEEGFWRTPQTAVTLETDWRPGSDSKRIAEVAEELSTLSSADQISIDEKSISLFINNLELRGRKDLEKFLALCAELNRLTEGECFFVEELEDFDSPFPRILRFDLDDAGQWHYQIAAV